MAAKWPISWKEWETDQMDSFYMNGILWRVKIVNPYDPRLVDRTSELKVATTDPVAKCVYLSGLLDGDFFNTVLIHELAHCAMISFGLIEYIHIHVEPEYWIDVEEFMCNFIADYGLTIFRTAYDLFGDDAIRIVPGEIEKYVA